MRVLITPEWYPWPDQPVYAVFCREQARAVARLADVAVLTWRVDPTIRVPFRINVADEDGLRTFRVRFARVGVPKATSAFKLAGCVAALAQMRRGGWRPDVIHAHEYIAGQVALSLGALVRAPVIFTEHYSGFSTLPDRERRRARWAFERAALVCPVSRELAEHIRVVAPRAKLEPVPNVVDTDAFSLGPARDAGGVPRLVTVGSLIERKGHRHLITAIARLREQGFRLMLDIIGDGPLRSELERLVDDLDVTDAVNFLGAQPKTAVAARMRAADAFVLASLRENLPCAILEAMSAGLPVVATRTGGVPEIVDESAGVLVTPGSAEALAAGLRQMVTRLPSYDRARLRSRAVADFGYDSIARRWTALYAASRQ